MSLPSLECTAAVALTRLRENMGLSQRELADHLDWLPSEIKHLEEGKLPLRLAHLNQLTQFFGTTLHGILAPDAQSLAQDAAFDFRRAAPLTREQIGHLASFRTIVNNYLRMDALARQGE